MLTHQPCPKCDSSDACTFFDDGGWYCHSCKSKSKGKSKGMSDETSTSGTSSTIDIPSISTNAYRGLEPKTLKAWGIRGPDSKGHYYFPLYVDGKQVNYKINQPEVDKQKYTYHTSGFKQKEYELFGSHVPDKSTKAVTIVFGMWDAPSLFQILGGYPVRAVPSDTIAVDSIQNNFEDLNKFDTIKILLDNDDACKKNVDLQRIATIFPGKVEVIDLPESFPKDANEALTKGKAAELVKRWWASQPVKLKAFCDLSELHDDVFSSKSLEYHTYPWQALNTHCWGWMYGSMDIFLAGSSIGKSLLLTSLSHHILTSKPDTHQAVFFLEDPKRRAASMYMAIDSGIPFHNPKEEFTDFEKETAWNNTLGTGKIHLFDQTEYGKLTSKSLLDIIELTVRVNGCKVVILDHISFIMSGNANENTLALTDEFLTELKQLALRLNIYIATCCHLRKSDGKPWEEGRVPSMEDARGTGAIYQLANNIYGLARNKKAESEEERNTTSLHVSKCRDSGYSGHCLNLKFSMRPFKLTEVEV